MSTLHHSLLQATLKASGMSQSITDDVMTGEIQTRHSLADGAAAAVKKLMHDQTKAIRSAVGKMRKTHLNLTFEGVGDSRILPVGEQSRYQSAMTDAKGVVLAAVADFIANYPAHIETERAKFKDRFDEAEYPRRESLPDVFRVEWALLPMPDPNAFLQTALTGHVAETLRNQYEAQLTAAVNGVQETTRGEIMRLLAKVRDTLKNPDGRIIESDTRKGALQHLIEWAQRVPAINVTNSPELAALATEINTRLNVSAETIRGSGAMRGLVGDAADQILTKFSKVGQRRFAA